MFNVFYYYYFIHLAADWVHFCFIQCMLILKDYICLVITLS